MRLKQLQNKLKLLESIPFSEENFRKEKEVIQEIELIMLREEMTLHQRSRINWLSYGDKNSAFFMQPLIKGGITTKLLCSRRIVEIG